MSTKYILTFSSEFLQTRSLSRQVLAISKLCLEDYPTLYNPGLSFPFLIRPHSINVYRLVNLLLLVILNYFLIDYSRLSREVFHWTVTVIVCLSFYFYFFFTYLLLSVLSFSFFLFFLRLSFRLFFFPSFLCSSFQIIFFLLSSLFFLFFLFFFRLSFSHYSTVVSFCFFFVSITLKTFETFPNSLRSL